MTTTAPARVNSYRLLQLLQLSFAAQAREVLSRLTLERVVADDLPDLTHWSAAVARVVKPTVLEHWQSGIAASQRRVEALLARSGRAPAQGGGRRIVLDSRDIFGRKAFAPRNRVFPLVRKASPLSMQFDLFNPRVLDAVDAATLAFCRETNETAVTNLRTATAQLRDLLKRGLPRGDAVAFLHRQVLRIFAEPARAFRIAATESSRAMHGGALQAAKENPVVGGKMWLASSDACELCLELDGLEKRLDEPFYVESRGGPYAIIMAPPLHPHCFCDMTETLA